MSSPEAIKRELDTFEFDASAPSRLAAIAEDIEANPDGATVIGQVLRLFERFPEEDFGAPGPLAHAIEKYYKRGYELELEASLERGPTPLTLWLANRIINANDENAPRFRRILRFISTRGDLPETIVAEAREYVSGWAT